MSILKKSRVNYNAALKNGDTKFEDLPAEAQTVIASVSFQYGANLKSRAPMFWGAVISQNWKETGKILNDFGDAYPTRRGLEAGLLENITNDK